MMELCKHCLDMMGGSWPMLGSKCTCGNRAIPSAEVCEHGHLRRACEVCELKAEVARLREVCKDAADDLWGVPDCLDSHRSTKRNIESVIATLAAAGKEPTP